MKNHKLVPLVATEQMVNAGDKVAVIRDSEGYTSAYIANTEDVYAAMVAACPEQDPSEVLLEITGTPPYQYRVGEWVNSTFGADETPGKKLAVRNWRYFEESAELVQALGCTEEEAYQIVAYVFGRPVGEPGQEVGGAMVTLAALCNAAGIEMYEEGNIELHRISQPEMVEKIREKQASKPDFSPTPEAVNLTATLAKLNTVLGKPDPTVLNALAIPENDLRGILLSCIDDFQYVAKNVKDPSMALWLNYRALIIARKLNETKPPALNENNARTMAELLEEAAGNLRLMPEAAAEEIEQRHFLPDELEGCAIMLRDYFKVSK